MCNKVAIDVEGEENRKLRFFFFLLTVVVFSLTCQMSAFVDQHIVK